MFLFRSLGEKGPFMERNRKLYFINKPGAFLPPQPEGPALFSLKFILSSPLVMK